MGTTAIHGTGKKMRLDTDLRGTSLRRGNILGGWGVTSRRTTRICEILSWRPVILIH